MYQPESFRVEDHDRLFDFLDRHGFGVLVSADGQCLVGNHLPFLANREAMSLCGHMARANGHWNTIDGEVLAVFTGPDAYISPTWYEEENVVPTWNYVAVHVTGRLQIVDDENELRAVMEATIAHYERGRPEPWALDLDSEFSRRLLDQIVVFRLDITRIEGTWKLSQHHSAERRDRVGKALAGEQSEAAREIGRLMRDSQ